MSNPKYCKLVEGKSRHTFKLVLLGDSSVGKTSIARRMTSNTFSEFQESTIGASFMTKHYETSKEIINYEINPEDYGLNKADPSELIGDTPTINAQKILKLLDGEKGAFRNIVILNAAAAIYVFGIAENIKHGVELANKSIDEGSAKSSLEKLIKASNEK